MLCARVPVSGREQKSTKEALKLWGACRKVSDARLQSLLNSQKRMKTNLLKGQHAEGTRETSEGDAEMASLERDFAKASLRCTGSFWLRGNAVQGANRQSAMNRTPRNALVLGRATASTCSPPPLV